MAANKGHNPLSIGMANIPPDFVNDDGVKWWRISIGEEQDGIAYLVDKDDEQEYVVIKDGKGIYATRNLEFLASHFEMLKLKREIR